MMSEQAQKQMARGAAWEREPAQSLTDGEVLRRPQPGHVVTLRAASWGLKQTDILQAGERKHTTRTASELAQGKRGVGRGWRCGRGFCLCVIISVKIFRNIHDRCDPRCAHVVYRSAI